MPQSTVIALAAGLALVAVLALVAILQIRVLRKNLLLARGPLDEMSIIDSVAEHVRRVQALRDEVQELQQTLAVARRDVAAALRHVAVVRYDAFGDMGGRLSFSAALLDDNGDGLLISSIHGHTESRVYVKTVSDRKADGRTSPEEQEAIATASPIGS